MFCIILAVIFLCFVIYLISSQLREHAMKNDTKILELKQILQPFYENKEANSLKDIDLFACKKSYTLNKRKVYLCLKDENGDYYDNNMLIYVLLHEYAHVLCDEHGHTEKFWEIFEKLLIVATKMGIYNPNIPIIDNYCEY